MNINNVTALLAQDKLVALSDINPNESYLVVNVKQVNRGTEEFFPYALPVSELSNMTILTGDIYYVDSLYGNNATGTVSDFTKPYLTIAAAFAAITPGDKATIYVRSGVYTGEIISLQDQVDYYLEPGAVFSSTSINSPASGISNIFGSGRFVNSSINITNEITGVFEFDTFEGNSTRVFVASINSGDSDFILKGNSIVCNGFLNFETQGNIDLTVNVKRITINTWFGFTYYNYTGKTIFNVDYIDGVGAGNFALHFSESNTTSAAEIIYNIGGQITHQPNFNGFNYTFFVRGGKVTLNGKLVASGAPGVLLQNGGTNTEFKLNGYINAARQALVMNAGNGGRAFIQGRLETQGVAGSDVILFSSVSINGQAGGSSQLYLTDTMLINQLNNGNMINMSGAGVGPINDVYCYNVTGYSPGVNGFFVYSSTVGASRTIGNHNVRSNKTLDLTNVSESFSPSGFISDAAFVLPINI